MNILEIGLNEKSQNAPYDGPLSNADFTNVVKRAIETDPDVIFYASAASFLQGLSHDLTGLTAEDVWALPPEILYSLPVKRPRDVDGITSQEQFKSYRRDETLLIKDTPNGAARVIEPFHGFEVITDDTPWGNDLPSYRQIRADAVPVFISGIRTPAWCASPEHIAESYGWLNRTVGRNGVWKGDDARVAFIRRAQQDGVLSGYPPVWTNAPERAQILNQPVQELPALRTRINARNVPMHEVVFSATRVQQPKLRALPLFH